MNPTHQVTLTTRGLLNLNQARGSNIRSRTFKAVRHAHGWEIILGFDACDGCATVEWVEDNHVQIVASLETPPIHKAPPVRGQTMRRFLLAA